MASGRWSPVNSDPRRVLRFYEHRRYLRYFSYPDVVGPAGRPSGHIPVSGQWPVIGEIAAVLPIADVGWLERIAMSWASVADAEAQQMYRTATGR